MMNRLLIFALGIFLLCTESVAQKISFEPTIAIGRNGVMDQPDSLFGGWVGEVTLAVKIPLGESLAISPGVGFITYRSIGFRDYSVLFSCDNKNGQADIYNSWFEYGQRGSYLTVPLLAQYEMGRTELEMGLVGQFLLNQRGEAYLYECGEKTSLRTIEINTFQLADYTIGAILGANIGLDPMGRFRIKPRVSYFFTDTADDPLVSFNTLIYEIGFGIRFGVRRDPTVEEVLK